MLWPDHGIAGTPNSAIHPAIDQTRIEAVVRKGFRPALDSYSAFFENDRQTPTGLEAWLRQRGFSRLFLCGLATDFCVAWSAEDAARLGFAVAIFEDACRGIGLPAPGGRTTIDTARDRLTAIGVRFIDSDAISSWNGSPYHPCRGFSLQPSGPSERYLDWPLANPGPRWHHQGLPVRQRSLRRDRRGHP